MKRKEKEGGWRRCDGAEAGERLEQGISVDTSPATADGSGRRPSEILTVSAASVASAGDTFMNEDDAPA